MDEIRQDPRLAFRPPADRWLDVAAAVSLIAAGTALLAATATVLTWANLQGMRSMLSAEAADRMSQGATATTVCASVLVVVVVLRYSFGRRGNRAAGVLMAASVAASLLVPLLLQAR